MLPISLDSPFLIAPSLTFRSQSFLLLEFIFHNYYATLGLAGLYSDLL